jgi:hypothetical protein
MLILLAFPIGNQLPYKIVKTKQSPCTLYNLVNNSVFFYFGEFQENFNSGALSVFSKIERVAEIDGRAQAF